MRHAAIILALLLFEPILIDEATYKEIMSAAHAQMRGLEYDTLTQIFNQLEQRATQKHHQPASQDDGKSSGPASHSDQPEEKK